MASFFSSIFAWFQGLFWSKHAEISVVGLQASGKTSFVNILGNGEWSEEVVPTVAFNLRKVRRGNITVKVWDVAGQPKFRSMWARYCRGVDAIIFVVDSTDTSKFESARFELHSLMDQLNGVPLLVLGNKNDLEGAVGVNDLIKALQLESIQNRPVSCYSCSMKTQHNVDIIVEWLSTGSVAARRPSPVELLARLKSTQNTSHNQKPGFKSGALKAKLLAPKPPRPKIGTKPRAVPAKSTKAKAKQGEQKPWTLEHWLQFSSREAAVMKDTAGTLRDILVKWADGKPRDLDVAAAILAAAFRQLRCFQLSNRGWDNLSKEERTDLQMSQRCLRTSVKPKLFHSEPMQKAMEHWLSTMRDPKEAETLRELVKATRGEETTEVSQAYLVLESRRHAILRILAQLPPSIVTPDIKEMPLYLWENAVHLLMAEDARNCLNESLYVPRTHPGRGRYPISRWGDTYSREAFKKIRAYMEAEGLEFGKSGRFEWYLPVPVSSERTILRPGMIVKGVIRPPARETGSSALTRIKRDPKTAPPVPRLAHGLDRVLFNPSVHWLQDPTSGVFNFAPQIQSVPPLKSFDFEGITPFVPSSQDTTLRTVARDQKKQFTGSTSSLTFLLTHIYYLISRNQKPDISFLSSAFNGANTNRTTGMITPGSIRINYDKTTETYAFDSSKGPDADDKFGVERKNVLTWMGTMLEKFLTLRPKVFNTLLKQASGNIDPAVRAQVPKEEAYQYSTSRNFVMRSQLDCVDKRLPGTGVFDIKTRATLAVRHDRLNVKQASAYTIIKPHGLFESFEREMYDLIRSAMIKYNFQARIGNMAGIFLAYHNTAKILGFQYLSVEDMDTMLFGSHLAGNRVFDKSIAILDMLAENIVKDWPRKTIEITFEGRRDRLRIWVEHSPKDAKPKVVEYTLEVFNYVNGKEVTGTPPLSDPDSKWDIRYKLQRSIGYSHSGDEVFRRYKRARKAQEWINKLVLPPGVSSDAEIRTLWEDIDLSLPDASTSRRRRISQKDVKKLRRHFMKPYPLLLQARELADAARKRGEGSPENDRHDG